MAGDLDHHRAMRDKTVIDAAVLRTARKLFDGMVFAEPHDSGSEEGHE